MEKKIPDSVIESLLLEGCSDREIAQQTGLSARAIGKRIRGLYKHYGIEAKGIRRVQLTVLLFRRSLQCRSIRGSRKGTATEN